MGWSSRPLRTCLGQGSRPAFKQTEVFSCGLEEFLILDVVDVRGADRPGKEGEIGDELSQPEFRRLLTQPGDDRQERFADGGVHGRTSPIVGNRPKGTSSVSSTSTRIVAPGSCIAMRVARVTPS